jgi:hypothetical protein
LTDEERQDRNSGAPWYAGWLPTPTLRRSDLARPRRGPCIVEEYDATCLVPPDALAALDVHGNIRHRAVKITSA